MMNRCSIAVGKTAKAPRCRSGGSSHGHLPPAPVGRLVGRPKGAQFVDGLGQEIGHALVGRVDYRLVELQDLVVARWGRGGRH